MIAGDLLEGFLDFTAALIESHSIDDSAYKTAKDVCQASLPRVQAGEHVARSGQANLSGICMGGTCNEQGEGLDLLEIQAKSIEQSLVIEDLIYLIQNWLNLLFQDPRVSLHPGRSICE